MIKKLMLFKRLVNQVKTKNLKKM